MIYGFKLKIIFKLQKNVTKKQFDIYQAFINVFPAVNLSADQREFQNAM